MAELTPMKQQYQSIKAKHEDCLLFFRLGDFYEMFDDDAVLASRELDLALTTRDRGKPQEEQTPMCGVPYHSAEAYIGRLIAKGYKIAICEQLEDPALAKGLVTRDVIRIISPGTVTESSMLEEGRSNYIGAVGRLPGIGAVCFADVSSGEIYSTEFTGADDEVDAHLVNEIARFSPREIIVNGGLMLSAAITDFLGRHLETRLQICTERFDYSDADARVLAQFHAESRAELGLSENAMQISAVSALLSYLQDTQKFDLSHINHLQTLGEAEYMELDYTAMRSLELTQSLRSGEKKGSLLWVLDYTGSPLGSRMLRTWVERPLLNIPAIRRRLSAVGELTEKTPLRSELMLCLKQIGDLRRLAGRCVYATASGKDVKVLGDYFALLPQLAALLADAACPYLKDLAALDPLPELAADIRATLCDDAPFSIREGGLIRAGCNEEVDRLRSVKEHGRELVLALEARERERTGLKKLKVGYNKVFGYYIEISRAAAGADFTPPADYVRKQTLANCERYFTQELKELEETLLTAGDRLNALEYELFCALRARVAAQIERIQSAADAVGALDCLCSLAEAAVRNHYCMPEVDAGCTLQIEQGRHPVVEQMQKDTPFVPNDVFLNDTSDIVAVITGPNMAGKSTYMRQTALITLMAQMGSFVPAKSATIGIVDRVFTRIGASDDLASGQSTFMVEMNEMAAILRHATKRSLLILDEIGRGTSTYDGMAIARAVLEHCADRKRLGAKTMFATHYHELSALEGELSGVRNYSIRAEKRGEELRFLRRIVRGGADDSYGVEVAQLAGLPEGILRRARTVLTALEAGETPAAAPKPARAAAPEAPQAPQLSLAAMALEDVCARLRSLDVNQTTPLEALAILNELKRKVES